MEFNMMQYNGEYPFNFNGFKVKPGMWYGTGWGNVPVATFGVRRGGKVLFFIGDGSHWNEIWIDEDDRRIPIDVSQWIFAKYKALNAKQRREKRERNNQQDPGNILKDEKYYYLMHSDK